jgi:hypothetical protein
LATQEESGKRLSVEVLYDDPNSRQGAINACQKLLTHEICKAVRDSQNFDSAKAKSINNNPEQDRTQYNVQIKKELMPADFQNQIQAVQYNVRYRTNPEARLEDEIVKASWFKKFLEIDRDFQPFGEADDLSHWHWESKRVFDSSKASGFQGSAAKLYPYSTYHVKRHSHY